MNEKMPCGILSEKDLDAYGEYLKSFDKKDSAAEITEYLTRQKGKTVTVESVICGKIEKRTGKLMEVGSDCIVIKIGGCQTVVCRLEDVKFITVSHSGNTISKSR